MSTIDKSFLYELKSAILKSLKAGYNNIEDIYRYLSKEYSKEQIRYCLNYLLVSEESIVRDDLYYSDSKYKQVNKRQEKSVYTKHYRSFTDDNPDKNKKILLVSDTHIGNSLFENMDLINKVYVYALNKGCDLVFHQGDLFDGKNEKQIDTFIKEYPNCLRTICLTGNHDKNIKSIKSLNNYNNSFNIYEIDSWSTKLNRIPIHLSHRLYISWIMEEKKISSINDMKDVNEWLSNDYRLLISGHLHQGIIYSSKNYDNKYVVYLGVPSLSNINISNNKAVAYILEIYNDMINISVLSSNSNLEIKEIDQININLNKSSKVLTKSY